MIIETDPVIYWYILLTAHQHQSIINTVLRLSEKLIVATMNTINKKGKNKYWWTILLPPFGRRGPTCLIDDSDAILR